MRILSWLLKTVVCVYVFIHISVSKKEKQNETIKEDLHQGSFKLATAS